MPRFLLHPAAVLTLSLLSPAVVHPASAPAPRGTGGAVVSEDRQATAVGLAALADGGNAVDAAVATALALAVTFPEAGNLGGGGFAVVRLGGELATLDFRETAPAAATRDMYLDAAGEPRPEASLVGPLAAGVPGSPAGLWELHRRFGRLPWARVVEPARRLAAEGFTVDDNLVRALGEEHAALARFPETAGVWLPGGAPPPVGARIVLPDLAATLAAYAEGGPEAIAAGPAGRAIEQASRRHGGVLTVADLAGYRPVWRAPLTFTAYGWEFAAMDLPSSGGVIGAQALALLERADWAGEPRFGAGRAHRLAEALRRAFADRYLLGDPASTRATAVKLLAPAYLAFRAATIDPLRATGSRTVGDRSTWPGPDAEATETTHLSVVDGQGDLVALTTTLNGLFGCGLWVPGAGFFLNNEMDDFATAPGRPNLYGLVQGDANAVAAGRRMLSSMAPTIVWRGAEAVAAGGRGGARIPSHTFQVLLNVLVDGDPLQTALDRPRLHHQWLPDELWAEPDALAPETRAELERRGHRVVVTTRGAKVQAVRRLADGRVEAALDPRSVGAAGVVRPEGSRVAVAFPDSRR